MSALSYFITGFILLALLTEMSGYDTLRALAATGVFGVLMMALPLRCIWYEWKEETVLLQATFSLVGLAFAGITASLILPDMLTGITFPAPLNWWVTALQPILVMLVLASAIMSTRTGTQAWENWKIEQNQKKSRNYE